MTLEIENQMERVLASEQEIFDLKDQVEEYVVPLGYSEKSAQRKIEVELVKQETSLVYLLVSEYPSQALAEMLLDTTTQLAGASHHHLLPQANQVLGRLRAAYTFSEQIRKSAANIDWQ